MNGGAGIPLYTPRVVRVSAKLTPTASTRTITSPDAGCGSGISRTSRTSGPPARAITTAFISLDCTTPNSTTYSAPAVSRGLRSHRGFAFRFWLRFFLWLRLRLRFRARLWLFLLAGSGTSAAGRQGLHQPRAVRTAPTRACVPARPGFVIAVVARGDVAKRCRLSGHGLVERRVQVANSFACRLVDEREQPSPQRRHRAGAPNRETRAIDLHLVSGRGIGIAAHIGKAASLVSLRIRRRRDVGLRLPRGQREVSAHPAAGRSLAVRQFVPHYFARNRAAADLQRRAAASQCVRTRCRKV